MTVWNGICVKIKFEYFSLDLQPSFYLSFSKNLSLDDVPMPEIYLTSEDNAYGIINYGWANGEELKIDLEGVEQVIFWDLIWVDSVENFDAKVESKMHKLDNLICAF